MDFLACGNLCHVLVALLRAWKCCAKKSRVTGIDLCVGVGTSDLSGQMVAALASSAIVQARFNSSGSGNGSRYTDLMDNAKFLYGTVSLCQRSILCFFASVSQDRRDCAASCD